MIMTRTLRAFPVLILASMVLSACGGGGSGTSTEGCVSGISGLCSMLGTTPPTSPGTTTSPSESQAAPSVTLALLNASGASSNSLTGATPLTVKATVLDASKKPVPNSVVSFATDNALATFSPTSGTALTDANGVASVSMRAANLAAGGAGTVTASSTVGTTTATGKANYAVSATPLTFGTLSASPASIQAYGSTVLSVDLMNGASKYTDQPVNVSFGSACVTAGKATMAATAQTNNGTAQVVYRDKGCGNNDVVTVSADGAAKPVTAALTIAPPAAASVQFVQALPSDKSIVIKSEGGNGRTETAILTFKIIDIFGNPLAGRQVNFSRVPFDADVVLNKSTDTSDANGVVVTTVNSGTMPTSFRILAALPAADNGGANISTLSDTVVVTTGILDASSFSLSTNNFNVDGTIDSSPTSPAAIIQVMLADRFSNPVPDGTPIVFRTNLGAIGSSDRGGCITINGGCAVGFRVQEPRVVNPSAPPTPCNSGTDPSVMPDFPGPGVATICATTTDGMHSISRRIPLFLSGSIPVRTTMNGSVLSIVTPNDLGSIAVGTTKVFQLQINDINDNPMPHGTKIALDGLVNVAAGDVLPATVPNIAPNSGASGPQGSIHTFSVSNAAPSGCVGSSPASFYVVVTTPAGRVTFIPFKLQVACK